MRELLAVEYAYATSTVARRLGRAKDGAYYVSAETRRGKPSGRIEAGPFSDRRDALSALARIIASDPDRYALCPHFQRAENHRN